MYEVTTFLEKGGASLINVIICFLITLPVVFKWGFGRRWRYSMVVTFFLYNLGVLFFLENRCVGMMVVGSYWPQEYPFYQQFIYTVLYSLSFSTILISIWIPFDLLLINLLLIQLPCIAITDTTLHGYAGGDMTSVTSTDQWPVASGQ